VAVRRVIAILAVAIATLASSAALASAPSAPGYLTAGGGGLDLHAGPGWTGAVVVHGTNDASRPSSNPSAAIWAASCGKAAQTVSFTRAVALLGPLQNGQVYFSIRSGHGWKTSPVTRLSLSVNGRSVYDVAATSGSFPTRSLPADAFRVGANTLRITARRHAGRFARCNTSPKSLVGVTMSLSGGFRADLRVGTTGKSSTLIVHGLIAILEGVAVTNDGPDAVLGGTFHLELAGMPDTETGIAILDNGGVESCKASGAVIDCVFGRLDPGKSISPRLGFRWIMPAGSTSVLGSAQESVKGLIDNDPALSNNVKSLGFRFCGAGAPPPC
jgi:hypothetical protein